MHELCSRVRMASSFTSSVTLLQLCVLSFISLSQVSSQQHQPVVRPPPLQNFDIDLDQGHKDGGFNYFAEAGNFGAKNGPENNFVNNGLNSNAYNNNGNKRYLDSLAAGLIKKDSNKRFLDAIGGHIIRKSTEDKRFIDSIGSDIFKKDANKRYLDRLGSSLIKKSSVLPEIFMNRYPPYYPVNDFAGSNGGQNYDDFFEGQGFLQDGDDFIWPGQEENIAQEHFAPSNFDAPPRISEQSKVFKFNDSFNRFLPEKKENQDQKRFLDSIAGHIFKKDFSGDENIDNNKRYLDGIASSLIKRGDSDAAGEQQKRYLDNLGSSLIKRDYQDDASVEGLKNRMFQSSPDESDDLKHIQFMESNMNFQGDQQSDDLKENKRYLDRLGSSLIKKNVDESEMGMASNDKRYMDSLASSLIKREDGEHESDKRYLDNVGSSLIKKSDDGQEMDTDKRYLDTLGSSLVKKDTGDKRYLDTLSSSLIKKDVDDNSNNEEKRYLDTLSSSLIKKDVDEDSNNEEKRYLDNLGSSLIKKNDDGASKDDEKRYLDKLGSSLIKKEHENPSADKRYLDQLGSSLIKRQGDLDDWKLEEENDKEDADLEDELYQVMYENGQDFQYQNSMKESGDPQKRYLDGLASSLIKKQDNEKRYLDGIASSLIKKQDNEKRYLDGLASSLIKKDTDQKRYLDGLASSLIKKDDGEKRYLDGIASSLIKKEDMDKRYLDGLASSLIKKDTDQKRYLDGLASSLIKKEDGEKRYLDGIASSLIKKKDNEKRYLDGLASSLIKKNDGEKRYLDGIASSLIKKDDGEKRYLDGIASSLIKKESNDKRYLDGIASSLIKKDDDEMAQKRYLDGIASSLIKKDDGELAQKRYLDGIASSLIKKDTGEKRYLDGIASSLIKKDSDKRYLDNLASSLVKKEDHLHDKRYLDNLGSSLIKKQDSEKRYLDGIASSLIKKEDQHEKRYLDNLGSSLIKRDDSENPADQKRYLDNLGSSLIKRQDTEQDETQAAGPEKRVFEVTDDVMDGSKEAEKEKDELVDSLASAISSSPDDDSSASKQRKRRDVSLLPFGQGQFQGQSQSQRQGHSSLQRQKRFIDAIGNGVLYKRFSFSPRSLKKNYYGRPQQDEEEEEEEVNEEDIEKLLNQKHETRPLWSQKQSPSPSLEVPQQPIPIYPNAVPTGSSFSYLPQNIAEQSQQPAQVVDQPIDPTSLMENPSQFQFSSYTPEGLDLDGIPKSLVSGTFWTFNKIDPIYDSGLPSSPIPSAQPQSYEYGQVLYPYLQQPGQVYGNPTSYALPSNANAEQRWTATSSGNQGKNNRPENEMYKRVVDDRTRELEELMKHPYIDKVAAMTFDKNKVFKKRYLDSMASSLLHKRYLDSLATGLIKRDRDSTKYVTDRFRRKRFSTKYSPTIKPQFNMNKHVDSLKRYIDSIASDLLYKRGPKAQQASLRAPRLSSARFGDSSQRVFFPMTSMRSRLRSFQPQTAPKGKKLASAAITWGGRPTLMTAMLATGKGPDDEETKAYLHHALKEYVRDVTKSILSRAKTVGEKLNRRQNDERNYILDRTQGNNNRWYQGRQRGNQDFFDSLAGGLLT